MAQAVVLSVIQEACIAILPNGVLKDLAPIAIIGGDAFEKNPKIDATKVGAQFLSNDPETVAEQLAQML